jgi:hypothetical protein
MSSSFYFVQARTDHRWEHVGHKRSLPDAVSLARSRARIWGQPAQVVDGDGYLVVEIGTQGQERRARPGFEPVSFHGHADHKRVEQAVRRALSPELLHEPYRSRVQAGGCDPMTGHCYVASEALFHLLGGKRAGWTPMFVRHEGEPHWFLRGPKGQMVDITSSQFRTPVPYETAKAKGFLTLEPSARARAVIERTRTRS